MKKIMIFSFFASFLISCKKDSIKLEEPINYPSDQIMNKIGTDCDYIKLTQNAQGLWQAYYAGVLVKFSDLHIKNDGRLYGRIVSADNCILMDGYEDANERKFEFQNSAACTNSATKLVTTSNTIGSSYGWTFNSGTYTSGSSFLLSAVTTLQYGITYSVNSAPPTNYVTTYEETSYTWNTPINCGEGRVWAGKFVAKNVVQNSLNGPFSYSEFGIAPLCYADQPVQFFFAIEE